jgi:long-chain acyl-CoA synthetase
MMEVTTLNHLYFDAVDRHRKPDAFRTKRDGRYRDVSHEDFARRVERASLGLLSLGIAPGDRVAILSENRLEWALADFAVLCARAITVPIYPTLLSHQIEYQLKNSGAKIACVSTAAQLEKIDQIRRSLPDLAHVIAFDAPPRDAPQTMTLEGLMSRGADFARTAPDRHRELALAASPEELVSIIYTSGTTGVPKGVMLSHRNIASNVRATAGIIDFGLRDTCLSLLPLSHILERMAGQFAMFHCGVTIAYAESLETVPANLLEVKPTILIGVPRFYEKIHARVMSVVSAAPPARQRLFHWAVRTGWAAAERRLAGRPHGLGLTLRCALAERLVWRKIHAQVGGRVRLLISGGAPLAPELARFFFATGFTILEGYGLTETSPVIAVNTAGHTRLGTVGPPIPGIEVAIGADGEILTRGPHVMLGYFRDEMASREAIDSDGWFHTGDIGAIDPDGYLAITDRKKDLIITAAGKNIAPQAIENRLKASRYVAEAVMIGDRRKFPVALIVPDFASLRAYALEHGLPARTDAELCRNSRLVELVQAEVDHLSAEFAPYERVKRIALVDREFSIGAGELTPTMKVKRKAISEKYKELIESLYEGSGS